MNERIRELAEQAKKYALDAMIKITDKEQALKVYSETYNTTFAELIVKECCSKLKEMGEGWHEFAMNPPDGQAHNASGALFAAYRLKEDAVDEIRDHFGVEE